MNAPLIADPAAVVRLRDALEWATAECRKAMAQNSWEGITWDQTEWCGTAHCLAGHLVPSTGARPRPPGAFVMARNGGGAAHAVDEVAGRLLGVSERKLERLFAGGNSIRDLWREARKLAGPALGPDPADLDELAEWNWLNIRGVR